MLLVDTDPQDAGSAAWWLDRNGESPFDLAKETDVGLLGRLREVDDYQVVVVDTLPRLDSDALSAVVGLADLPSARRRRRRSTSPPWSRPSRRSSPRPGSPTGCSSPRWTPGLSGRLSTPRPPCLEAGVPAFGAFVRLYKVHERAPLDGVALNGMRGPHVLEALSDYRRVTAELMDLLHRAPAGVR